MEFAHHRARNRKPARDIFHLRESRFLRCADVNEKCDENQEWVPNQPDEPEDECKSLTDACRHLRRARITQSRCKERAQDAPAIHWKRRQQIEEKQQDVDGQQLCNETAPLTLDGLRNACDPPATNKPSAITTFTIGPARAITNSCTGFSGMRSNRATPPIGSKV